MFDFFESIYMDRFFSSISGYILKYALLSGGAFFFFYVLFKARFISNKIQSKFPRLGKVLFELKYSFLTMVVYSLFGMLYVYNDLHWGLGYKYEDVSEFGMFYLIFSFLFLLVWHDTYFYWTHRVMHHKRIYKYTHKVHHNSINPTPLAAYSFHPVETIVSFGFIPIAMALLPFHKSIFPFFLLVDFIHNVISHLGYEIYPYFFVKTKIGKLFATSTYHNIHHKSFTKNYSLYFTIWDRLMGTIDSDYELHFIHSKTKN